MDLTPEFNQYLRHAALPPLELRFDPSVGRVSYRWKVDEVEFRMPVKVGDPAHWQTITPTVDWQVMPTGMTPEQFAVATDLYYIDVRKEVATELGKEDVQGVPAPGAGAAPEKQ